MTPSKVLCLIAGVDHDTISTCPKTDQLWASHLGLALTLSFLVVSGITYHATSYIIESVPIRCIAALVIALTVLMFDRALFQSDWFFQPVRSSLRNEPLRWIRIVFRLGISFCLSFALALFLELAIFSDTITERLQQEFRTANASLFQRMADNQARLEHQIVERSEHVRELESGLSNMESDSGEPATKRSQAKLLELGEAIAGFEEDRNAELFGQQTREGQTGRAGQGAAYQFAQAQIDALTKQKRQVEAEAATYRATISDQRKQLGGQLDSARQELARLMEMRDASLLAYQRDLVEGSPEFQKQKDDPLARMAAYTELKSDPEQGPTIIFLSWLLRFAVMFLEVAPLAAKMLFGPPTVYATKIRTVLERERRQAESVLAQEDDSNYIGEDAAIADAEQNRKAQPLIRQLSATTPEKLHKTRG